MTPVVVTTTRSAEHRTTRAAGVQRRRRLGSWVLGVAAIGAVVVLLGAFGMSRGFLYTGDTNNLVAGSRVALDCAEHHVFRACAFDPARDGSKVGPYPLLQYLPALAMRGLGFGPRQVLRGLGWVNLAAFAVSLGLLASIAARRDRSLWRPLLVAIAASGPLWFYATAGFGEMLAATVLLGAAVACLHRRVVPILVLALLACLAKETLPPFVLALGLLAGRRDEDSWLPPRRVLVPLLIGVASGTMASTAFNVFRYDSVRNVNYLRAALQVHGAGRVGRNVVEVLLAPGGGLVLFWPAIVLLLVAVVVSGSARMRSGGARAAVPVAAVFAIFAAFTIGLALWWAPFGWIAWGPRLYLPLLPSLAVVMVHVGGSDLTRVVSRSLGRPLIFAAVLGVTLIAAFPVVSAPWTASAAVATVRATDQTCPRQAAPPGSPAYWRCFDHRAWRLRPSPVRAALHDNDALTWTARIVILGGIAFLLHAARLAAADEDRLLSPAPALRPRHR